MPNVNYRGKLLSKDPDLMTEEELSAAFEAMPLAARQEAMKRALDEEMGPVAVSTPIEVRYTDRGGNPVPYSRMGLDALKEFERDLTPEEKAYITSPESTRIYRAFKAAQRATDPSTPPAPTSGVTSIPLGAPWPPLSREQVVKLHEGLVAFRGEMEASKGIRSHEDQQDMIWGAAVELDGLLVEMSIGSPPPTRTWTHEEVAKVAEEVQNLAGVTVEESLRLDALAAGFKGLVEARERMERRRAGEALQAARDVGQEQYRSMVLHQPPIAKDEPPKRECWTCRSFHINNGCGKKGTASAALAAHLRKMDDMIDGGSSPVDVASMDLNCPGWEPKS